VFKDPASIEHGGIWGAVRRPLLLAFMSGCTISLWTSGRLSVRLIADGMISFAFLPIFEIVGLAVVWRRSGRIPFTRAIDLSFIANGPWLVWLIGFSALRSVLTPIQATAFPIPLLWTLEASLLVIAAWAAYIELHFFREVLQRSERDARRDLILLRAIVWTLTIGYFFGIALYPEVVGRISP
jgi:predicted neutral ceramidase superfamily lipid hydrolase